MADSQPPRAPLSLPARPSIEWLKKTAKERLISLRADDPSASLAMAQLAIARDYGFSSWRAMVGHLKAIQLRATPLPTDRKELEERFREAVQRHRLEDLRRLLQDDPTLVNAPLFGFGGRPISAARGHLTTIDLLLQYGADINLKSDWWAGGWGVLETADEKTAEALIARGATVDIFAAAHLDRLDRLRELLAADSSLVHAKGGDGCRPLHFARSEEAMDLLLSYGADINARDVDHQSTAAQWALPRPKQEIVAGEVYEPNRVRWLIDRGASVDVFMLSALDDVIGLRALLDRDPHLLDTRIGAKDYPPCPDAPGRHIYFYKLSGRTVFEVAKAYGSQACLDLLLTRGSPKQRFLAACLTADASIAHQTLNQHPKLMDQLTPADHHGLPNAAWAGNAGAVELMLDLGFDPLAAAADSGTALHCAAWHGRTAIVRSILEHSAVRSRLGELIERKEAMYQSTPLGWCCHGSTNCRNPSGDYPAVAKLLLDAGAKVGPNAGDASDPVRAVLEAFTAHRP